MGTLCSITNVFKDADGKFQVFLIETEGNQIQTQVLAPLNENGTADFSLKNPSVFLNGAELVYNSDYSLTTWEDTTDGKKKVQVNAMGDLTFKEKDYVLVWMQTKLGAEDIQFTSGQKITSTKLNQIFQALFNKLEELRSAGFAFASNTLFSKLAEGLQTVLDQYTQDKETELDNYVENTNKPTLNDYVDNTLKPDLDNYVNNINKPELDNYVDNTLKPDLDNYVDNTNKPELDNYVDNILKPDLNNYVNNTNKPELDNYVDNTLKPDLDNYTEQKKDEINDTASYLNVDKVDGKDASDFTPISHDTATQGVHGIVTPYFIAKTSREDQLPDWADIQNKPFIVEKFDDGISISTKSDFAVIWFFSIDASYNGSVYLNGNVYTDQISYATNWWYADVGSSIGNWHPYYADTQSSGIVTLSQSNNPSTGISLWDLTRGIIVSLKTRRCGNRLMNNHDIFGWDPNIISVSSLLFENLSGIIWWI